MEISVKEFGASGDGIAKDTIAIQRAIDKCHEAGGGKVIVESGVYLTSTLYLRDNIELHLSAGAKLQGSTNPDDYDDFKAPGFNHQYAPEGSSKCLICASGVENIAITGTGEINIAGPAFYDTDIDESAIFYNKPETPRPHMLIFYDCKNVKIENVSFIDSPCWTLYLIECEQLNIQGIKIIGDQRMINNDGIDIHSCRNVTVSDCYIKTSDDCIVVRAAQRIQVKPAVCENVTVTNCVLDSWCQGIRVGCPSDNVIRNCTFSNIIITSTQNGINIDNPKHYLAKGSNGQMDLQNIMFSNFTIKAGKWPVRIYVEEGVTPKKISGITFSNFRIESNLPLLIKGNKDTIIEDISFNNMNIKTTGDNAVSCKYCRRVKMNNVELSNSN